MHNPSWRAIGPRFGLSGGSWPILKPWQDGTKRRFSQKQVPEKQLVKTCRAGPSPSGGLVITWWSRTWHSLLHTRWARHGIPAPRGMQVMHSGLHMVCSWFTWYFRDRALLAPGRRFRASPGHHRPCKRPVQQVHRQEACQLLSRSV